MEASCPICIESFDKSTRAPIKCPNGLCNFTTCKECARTYLLSTTKDPCCMKCNHKFPSDFSVINLNRSFMEKDYRKHRKGLLLEREMSKLPETMAIAQRYREVEGFESENDTYKKEIAGLRNKLNELELLKNENLRKIWRIKNGKDKGEHEQKFIMPCPEESCRGFLSTAYKCGICNLFTCPKCLEMVGDKKINPDHVCDEDSVKTAELIKSTTKACPGCGERIQKLEGCDQMWCTGCHTAFSWKSGEIDTGTIHNPHFYQFQRNNEGAAPRNPHDIHCGGMPNWWAIRRKVIRPLNTVPSEVRERVEKIMDICATLHRTIGHISHISLVDTRNKIQELSDFQQLRIEYILHKISKEEMAKIIIRKDKMRRKYTELVHIFELLSIVGIDIFRGIDEYFTSISGDPGWSKHIITVLEKLMVYIETKFAEYHKLREYCNSQLEVISISFNQSVIQLDENFIMINKKFSLSRVKKKIGESKGVSLMLEATSGEQVVQVENIVMGGANLNSL